MQSHRCELVGGPLDGSEIDLEDDVTPGAPKLELRCSGLLSAGPRTYADTEEKALKLLPVATYLYIRDSEPRLSLMGSVWRYSFAGEEANASSA